MDEKRIVAVVLGLLLELSAAQVNASKDFHYECKRNGDIKISNLTQVSSIKVKYVVNNKGVLVEPSCVLDTFTNGTVIIKGSCMSISNKVDRILIVTFSTDTPKTTTKGTTVTMSPPKATTQSTIATFVPTPPVPPSPQIKLPRKATVTSNTTITTQNEASNITKDTKTIAAIARPTVNDQRDNMFIVICRQSVATQHISTHLLVENIVPIQPVVNSVGKVRMKFKSEKITDVTQLELEPSISSVYLGDRFYMYLQYLGNQDYKISPTTCTAYDGGTSVTNNAVNKVTLSTLHGCASSEASRYHLMHSFQSLNNKIVYAEIYGFQFLSGKDITIECEVVICHQNAINSNCLLNKRTDKCSNESKWRKRRNTHHKDVKVYGTFGVQKKKQVTSIGNAAQGHKSFPLTVVYTTIIIILLHSRR